MELNAETCLVCLPTTRSSSADRGLAGKRCTVTGYGFQHECKCGVFRLEKDLDL